MSETKQIILTGEAAQSLGSSKRRSRKNKVGGGSTQGAIVQLQSTTSSSDSSTAVEGINPAKIADISANISARTTILNQSAGSAPIKTKVVLKAPKKKTHKVVLSVAKTIHIPKHVSTDKAKTRKAAKRIQFSLKNLRNKLHKAKTIKKTSQEKSLSEIKKILSDAKLIKVDSKAPESMIRHIYNDFMTLKHKAL